MDSTIITSESRRRAVLATVSVALMMVVSAVSGLNVALPSLAEQTGATQTQITWIVDAYTVVFAGLLLFAGAVGDRFGRKRVLIGGILIFGTAAGLATFTSEPWQLIALRACMGVGAAFVMPATLSVITSSFPEEERGRAVGVWVGVAGGGAVLGLFATGLLLEWFAWNSFFALNVALSAAALAGTLAVVPTSRDEHPPSIEPLSAVLSLLGIGGLIFGIIEGATRGWSDPLVVGALIVGCLAITAFIAVELRKPAPLLDPRLFTHRGFGIGSLSVTAQFFAAFGFFFIVMQYLQYVNGYSALGAAVALLPMPVFLLPTARIAPRIAQRFGFAVVGAAGLTCIAIGFGIIASLGTALVYWQFALGVAIFAVGMGLAGTPATTAITAALPRTKQGVASAVNDTAREVGSAFGIAVLGSVLNAAYRDGMSTVAASLPPQAAEAVTNSVAFVARLPIDQMGDRGQELVAQAKDSFAVGVQHAGVVAGVVLLLTALAVLLFGPRRTAVDASDSAQAVTQNL